MTKGSIEQRFTELISKGLSLRQITKELGITYYRAQQLYVHQKGRFMLNPITYRTIPLPSATPGEATLRMLPYDLTADAMTLEEARDELLKGSVLPMSVELQLQPDFWVNFDFDALYSRSRAEQLEIFNNPEVINLASFGTAVEMNLTIGLMDYNYNICLAVLLAANKTAEDVRSSAFGSANPELLEKLAMDLERLKTEAK